MCIQYQIFEEEISSLLVTERACHYLHFKFCDVPSFTFPQAISTISVCTVLPFAPPIYSPDEEIGSCLETLRISRVFIQYFSLFCSFIPLPL